MLLFISLFILVCLISFAITSGITWLICWAFGLAFIGWKWCFGVWLILGLIGGAFKSNFN